VRDDVPQQPQDGGDRIVFDAVGTHGGGNRSRALLAGVLAAAVWLATAVTPAYALTQDRQLELLKTYQPVTWFSAAELFTPTNVGAFEGNVRLRWQSAPGTFSTTPPGSTSPTPEEIAGARNTQCDPGLRDPCWLIDESSCNAAGGVAPATLACYQNAWQAAGPQRVVYGRVFRSRKGWALQYWYFYYDHEFEPQLTTPGTATLTIQHEGDWQSVTVVLSPDKTPRWVGVSGHCLGLRRDWSAAPRIGKHPVAHVARGSHAGWFGQGSKRIPRAADCLSQAENAALDGGSVTVADTVNEGSVSGPPNLPGLGTYTPTGVILLSPAQTFTAYPGAWGEREFASIVVNGTTVASGQHGFSPPGPAHMGRIWTHPIGATHRWPTSYQSFR
jgi:hypothetical protein